MDLTAIVVSLKYRQGVARILGTGFHRGTFNNIRDETCVYIHALWVVLSIYMKRMGSARWTKIPGLTPARVNTFF
jgi:hypothetical protein